VWGSDAAGVRTRIVLGEIGAEEARDFRTRVRRLKALRRAGSGLTPDLAAWVTAQPPHFRAHLERWGLVDARQASSPRDLFGFWDWVADTRKDTLKPGSIDAIAKTRAHLAKYFTNGRTLASITVADAEGFEAWLRKAKNEKSPAEGGPGLANATVRLHMRNLKSVFRRAVAHEHILKSPFAEVSSRAVTGVREKPIPEAVALKVMNELPTVQHRLYFALARFAALRMPSEGMALTWDRVDWHKLRLHVYSPKLHRRGGTETKAWRYVPICPTLAKLLQSVYDAAPEGEARVLTLNPSMMDNAVERAAKRAGVPVWRRTFDTLRESCIVDWNDTLPGNVVPLIAGHSHKVEMESYMSVSDRHFDRISRPPANVADRVAATPENNRKQPATTTTSDESESEKVPVFAGNNATLPDSAGSVDCDGTQTHNLLVPAGQPLANVAATTGKAGSNALAPKGTGADEKVNVANRVADDLLAHVVARWPQLSPDLRRQIVKLCNQQTR
jgi:integrase